MAKQVLVLAVVAALASSPGLSRPRAESAASRTDVDRAATGQLAAEWIAVGRRTICFIYEFAISDAGRCATALDPHDDSRIIDHEEIGY